jgi:serine/threonine-protein kinase
MPLTAENEVAGPTRLGRYELRGKIADGGMAAVHVARRDDGEVVAIKMIREEFARSGDFLTMLADEAKIASRLRHPNIVRCHELGQDDQSRVFIIMELLLGQSLWAVWEACRSRALRLRYDVIAWIGARVADGLHYAHEMVGEDGGVADIVHRDVNAANIFVTYDGDVKIIDFGLAKAANRASKTAAGVIKGKVAYMSPEQAVGAPIDRRTDVFALGTTLWELSCDRRLFKHSDEVETLRRVHAADIPDPTGLVADFPPALWRVLRRALARDKEARYPTAAALARDLDAFAGDAVGACVAARAMRELFPYDRARQAAWIADASGPEPFRHSEPSNGSARLWADDRDVSSSASVSLPPAPSAPFLRPPRAAAKRPRVGIDPRVIAMAIIVAILVTLATALR